MTFHEIRFPTNISIASEGGPERRTEIVTLGSGHEERNTRWAESRRRFNAGYGMKSLNDLYQVIEFFEERRGKLHGFRWKDITDFKSTSPQSTITDNDQIIGTGNGAQTTFQLIKTYGGAYAPYQREVRKPVSGTVKIAVEGIPQQLNTHYTIEDTTGQIIFQTNHIPPANSVITAGFEFDVPVRFDVDQLSINISQFNAGKIPNIPIIEIRI